MRPPYGSYNSYVLDAAYMRGQSVVLWDFEYVVVLPLVLFGTYANGASFLNSEDSIGETPEDSIKSYERRISGHPSTMLLLNHETYGTTARQVLPAILLRLKDAGYRTVDVATCLCLPKYQEVAKPSPRDYFLKGTDYDGGEEPLNTLAMSFRSPFSQHLDTNHVPSSGEAASVKAFLQEEREKLRIIDATLELLSQALRRLSEDRALRQDFIDRHQALLSPVRALPTDVLHQLFLAMVPTVPEWEAYSDGKVKVHPVVNISHVCGHWRDVALSMPSLWTHIPIDPLPSYTSLVFAPRGRNAAARYEQSMARLTDLATTFTARAGDRPISFSLTGEDQTGHANPELAKVVDPLIDVLRKAQWANVSLDLYFFAAESTYARLLPVPPRTQDALRTLKVHFTGPGATMRQYTILNSADGSPRYLNLLDLNIPGRQLCDLRLNWSVLTSLSIGPVPGHHRWSGDGPMGVATLTPQQALVIMQRCPSLVQCEVRLYSGPAAASLPIASDPFLDAFTLPHLGTLKLLGRQAPKAFALSLMMPSLRHLSAIYDSGESMPPGDEESSGFVELVRRYGPQLLNVTFDYDSLTSSALKFCLSRLTNVTSLTMLPYLFEPRDSLSPTADSHTYSFDPDHDLLKALTPALNNGGADPLRAPFCFCPKLESVMVSLGYGEGYEHAQYWMDFVSGRRRGSLDRRTTSDPISYIREVFLTFHPLHKIEWDWRVDELREQGISAVGLVLDGNSYD